MIVLDASAAVALLLQIEPGAASVRDRLAQRGETLHAPHLLDLEVLQAFRRYASTGELSLGRAQEALDALRELRLLRYPHLPVQARIWELRSNLSAYDAAYIALAEALEAPLVTLDARLGKAPGIHATIETYG